MMRLYAKKNYVKSSWRFIREMWKHPVYYWAWLFHPKQMFKILFGGKPSPFNFLLNFKRETN